jgi:hypothetical protein
MQVDKPKPSHLAGPSGNVPLTAVDVIRLPGPSVETYRALIAALMLADQRRASGVHPLRAYIDVVSAFCQFIGSNNVLRQAGVSTTLRRLLADLEDRAAGSKPPAFFDVRSLWKGKGPPTNQSRDMLRGCLVGGLNALIEAGESNAGAARWLERALALAEVGYRGKPIKAAQLLQWREQTGDTAPQAADDAIRNIALICGPPLGKESPLERARLLASAVVGTVRRWNSR